MSPRERSDRHAAVTGAGTGIGRAIALRLASQERALTLFARDVRRLEETATLARELGAEVTALCCDIRDAAQVAAAFGAAAKAHGPLSVLVANSGIGGPNEPGPGDRFDDLVRTNLYGTYHCLRAAQRHLAPGPAVRHLIAISSILARIGVPGYTGYCASKAALLGLARALAAELAPENVQVNAVCPGWVNTEMARAGLRGLGEVLGTDLEGAREHAMREVPLRRMSEPEEIAGVVSWLVSPDARGVTGQGIDVNNGAFML